VLDIVTAPGFYGEVVRTGERFRAGLQAIADRRSDVRDIRGMGLMIGMEMEGETKPVAAKCLDAGLVVNAAAGNVLRFLPPLTVRDGEVDRALSILSTALPAEGRSA
jgi:acetylornithine/succinyldiaminopimelate/putrescine aminotransferase